MSSEHKVLIGGVECGITGGTVQMDGVEYELKKGLVLVGGVERDIEFPAKEATITITAYNNGTNTFYDEYVYIKINGVTYGSYNYRDTETVFTVPIGTVISCSSSNTGASASNSIVLNGKTVANKASYGSVPINYSYTVIGDATIYLYFYEKSYAGKSQITITET